MSESRVSTPRGEVILTSPVRRTSLIVATGHLELAHAEAIVRFGKKLLAQQPGPHASFHDYWGLTGYDTRARQHLTDWALEVRDRVTTTHALTRQRLVAMGVATVGLALSLEGISLTAHTTREGFERALAERVREMSR